MNIKTRDLFMKIWFVTYLNHVLRALGIDEEIEDILPTENIGLKNKPELKIFHQFLDIKLKTKSGKIIIFEFKKDSIISADIKQIYDYYKPEFCKDDENTEAIIVVTAKEGNITDYQVSNITFAPTIIRTKLINKQKDLKAIRDKINNNQVLTPYECSILIALPLFDIIESKNEIVKEACYYIKNKAHCIPPDEQNNIAPGMYLNIVEYIDKKEQEKLLEDINMEAETEGVFAQLKREQFNEGAKSTINHLLENCTAEELAELTKIPVSEILEILNK